MKKGALIFLFLIRPAAVLAANPCEDEVFDDARVFSAEEASGIRGSVREFAAQTGAMARVIALKNYSGQGSLQGAYEDIETLCQRQWRGADGIRLPQSFVFMITTEEPERDLGFFYGSQFERIMDAEGPRILDDVTVPRFQSGDIAGGVIATLREAGRALNAGAAAGTTIVRTGPPADLSGLWYVLGGLVALAGIVVIGLMLYRAADARRKRKEAQRKARESVRILKEELIGLVLEVPRLIRALEEKLAELAGNFAESEFSGVREAIRDADAAKQAAIEPYNSVRLSADAALSREDVSVGECETFAQSFREIRGRFEKAKRFVADGDKLADELRRALVEAPGLIQEVAGEAEAAKSAILRQKQDGYNVDKAEGMLAEGRALLRRAEEELTGSKPKSAAESAKQARDKINAARAWAEGRVGLRTRIAAKIDGAEADIERAKQKIQQAAEVFDRLAENYAESSWESVAGNGTEATNRVNWAIEAMVRIRDMSAMENQEWDAAEEVLEQVFSWLREAEELCVAIVALEKELREARGAAEPELRAAEEDITRAREFIRRYDADIRDSLEHIDLAAAAAKLDEAKREAAGSPPDYLKLVRLAREANELADKVLAAAREEHEQAERARKLAEQAVQSARTEIASARAYISGRWEVEESAKRLLAEAERQLLAAEEAESSSERKRVAEAAGKIARSAHESAVQDVRRNNDTSWGTVLTSPRPYRAGGLGGYSRPRASGGGVSRSWGTGSRSSGSGVSRSWSPSSSGRSRGGSVTRKW